VGGGRKGRGWGIGWKGRGGKGKGEEERGRRGKKEDNCSLHKTQN